MFTMLFLRTKVYYFACNICQSAAIQTKAYAEDQKMDSYF